jgi:type IV fimbrial biogenesis protein FimT
MLNHHRSQQRGVTLIELMVTLSIMALLLTAAAPPMAGWAANARVRGVAEQLQNSLRLAQAEAIRRNRQTVLALTNQTPQLSATPAANGQSWLVRSLPLLSGETASDNDYIQDNSSARQNGVTISGPALLCFNSVGRQVSNSATGLGASCSAPTDASTASTYTLTAIGAGRTLQLQVFLGGQVRLCDPSRTVSDSTPDGC